MKLLFFTPACRIGQSLLMDRAYEGDKMRAVAKKLGYIQSGRSAEEESHRSMGV